MRRAFAGVCLLALGACGKAETTVTVALAGAATAVGAAPLEGAALTLYGASDLVTSPQPTPLGQAQVASDGGWAVAAVDVASVPDAVVAVSAGTDALFPTLSGVVDYSGGQRRADLSTARLFIVQRAVAGAITTALGRPELLQRGFVLGLVTDGSRPIAGATVTAGDSLGLDVAYPSPDFSTVSRTETSASGLFVVAADPALLFLDLAAHKAGHAFAPTTAPLKSGLCSFAVVLPSAPATTTRVDVAGVVTALGAGPGASAGATVELLAPFDVASSTDPAALAGGSGTVGDGGLFSLSQVDVTDVSQGLLGRVSGAGLVPTVSGVTAWVSEADADKKGTSRAHLFAVPRALAAALAAGLARPTLLDDGFIVGLVTDGAAGVGGATIARADGGPLVVLYPSPTFASLAGTSTSASGLFVIPSTAGLGQVAIVASQGGTRYGPALLLPVAGGCFFPVLQP
jgi:hypothetical protein